jgi:WD40 repeat protein
VDFNRRLVITLLVSLIGLASLSALAVYLVHLDTNQLTALFPYTKKYLSEVNTPETKPATLEAVVSTNNSPAVQTLITLTEPKPDTTKPVDTPDETPTPRAETGLHTAAINQLALTHDGRLLTVSDDKTARLWSSNTKGEAQVLRVPIGARNEGTLYTVAASPTKNSAVVGGSTGIEWDKAGAVYGFDLNTGKITGRIAGIQGTIRVLSYSQDGRYLAIGSGSGWLRVLDLDGKSLAMDASICQDMLVAAKFLRDGRLITACLDGKLQLFDAKFQLQASYKFPEQQRPWRFAVSPKEDQIAVGSLDAAKISIFSLGDLKPVSELTGDSQKRGNLSVVAWQGDSIVGAGTYGNAQGIKYLWVWNTIDKKAQESPLAEDTVTDLIALANGTLAYTTAEPTIGIVDLTGTNIASRRRAIADFRDAFEGTFAVSEDGATVDFGLQQQGHKALRFNLLNRTLAHDLPARPDMHKPIIPASLSQWRNDTHTVLNATPVALDQNEQSRSAASLPENDSTVIGSDFSVQYWQADKLVWHIAVPSSAWAVNLTKNGRFVLAALGDGTLRWYDSKDGRELLALLVNTDERWIAWTPEGYFDHSDGAASMIGYHINQGKKDSPKFILSDQIHERFYRPDLIGKSILENTLSTPAPTAHDAKTLVAEHHAPSVRLVSWCVQDKCTEVNSVDGMPATRTVDSAEIRLRFALKDSGDGIGNVVIRRNKATVSTRTLSSSEINKSRAAEAIIEEKVFLESGDNLITVTAFDADESIDAGEAIRLPIHYEASTSPDAPTLYIVSVGIDQYNAPELPKLENAVNDAKGIIDILASNTKGLFSALKPVALLNEQAGLSKIKQALAQVAKQAKPNDLVVLFLAGHGISIDGRYYFMPHDAKLSGNIKEQIKATALTQKTLSDLLSALPTSRVAVLIDSCNAGAFAVMGSVVQNSSRERAWTGSLAQNTGRFVLAGTSTEQEALDGINGHGVFTSVLLEGLSGKADQEMGNRDQHINITELLAYTRQRVPEEARKISPEHAQNVSGFFAGSDFFDLTVTKP